MTAKRKPAPKTKTKPSAKPADTTAQRDRLLQAALPDVAFDGWSDHLIARAAAKAGIAPDEAAALFPHGVTSLLSHLSDWADRKTEEALLLQDLAALRVRERIALAVRTRLEILTPYKAAISAALGAGADPRRAARLPRDLWASADRMWWLAGDTSTDYNHYTKRLLLSGVIVTTTLYWLADTSDDQVDTWAFLDRRIDNVLKIGRTVGTLKDRLPQGLSAALPDISLKGLRQRLRPKRRSDAA